MPLTNGEIQESLKIHDLLVNAEGEERDMPVIVVDSTDRKFQVVEIEFDRLRECMVIVVSEV